VLAAASAAPIPIALLPALPAAAKPAAQVQPVPVAAALAQFVVEPALAGALFDGMTGVESTPAQKEEFTRLAAGLYAAAPGSPEAVSATGLLRRLSRPTQNPEEDSARRRLLHALLDLPRLTAEGMIRLNLRAPSAEGLRKDMLAAKWKKKDGLPIADAVIVGGGPTGLSTALQAADKGVKVVLFEAGYLAQSFSDAAVASARVELLQHFARTADEVERLGSRIVEKASVESVLRRADGLWEIRTSAGHHVLARKLVLAHGRKALRGDALTASLEKAGLLKRVGLDAAEFAVGADGLASVAAPDLFLAGARSIALSADSAIPGAVARATLIAGAIAKPAPKASRLQGWAAPLIAAGAALALGVAAFPLLAQAAFWTANVLAFVYIAPQIHRLLRNRSADISFGTAAIGFVSAAVMTMDFAHLGQALMTYRNLAQAGGFAILLGLKAWYDRRAPAGPASASAAGWRTALALAGLGLVLIAGGPIALAIAPSALWLNAWLVPFQMASGLGFTWLMMPQFEKIAREGRIGDASEPMAWGFVGTRAIWIWSLSTLAAIPIGGAAVALGPLALFSFAALGVSGLALSMLRRSKLTRWKGFLALAAVMAAEVLAGWLILPLFAPVPAGAESKYLMYLCYLVQNLTAFLAAIMTARSFRRP